MSEEELNKLIKEYYGTTIDEIEENCLYYTNKYWETLDKLDEVREENQQLKEENEKLKQPTIFIDTQDMEERYGEGLYMDYLEEQNKLYKSVLDEIREYIKEKAKEDEECADIRYINFGEGVDYDLLKILDKVKENE